MFGSSLPPAVCKKVHVLFTFLCCLLGHSKYHVLSIVLIYAALSLVKFRGTTQKILTWLLLTLILRLLFDIKSSNPNLLE